MRALIVCTLLLLWALPALAEQKSAPDGFGPIKFGMTKDEAWEAIGGQGEWDGDVLIHKVGIPSFMGDLYEARHQFVDGMADEVTVQNTEKRIDAVSCASQLSFILGIIVKKYGIYPINIDYRASNRSETEERHVSLYQFHYLDDSLAQVSIIKYYEQTRDGLQSRSCLLSVQYAPPREGWMGGL